MLDEGLPKIRDESFSIDAVPLLDQAVGSLRPALWMLLGGAGLLLIIAWINVANLILGREPRRRRELAVQLALGAPRGRIARQVVIEGALTAAAGGAAGLALAWAGVRVLLSIAPSNLPRLDAITVDGEVAGFVAAGSVVTGLVCGLAPARRAMRSIESIRGARSSSSLSYLPKKWNAPTTLVVAQVSLAFVLLVSAGLLVRSFRALLEVDPGFDAERVLAVHLEEPPYRDRTPGQALAVAADLLDRVRSVPGVRVAATGGPLPFSEGNAWLLVDVEGRETPPDEPTAVADERVISPGYFEAMGIRLLAGRDFERRDLRPGAAPVRIVDRRFAERFGPGDVSTFVGERVRESSDRSVLESSPFADVVGVVESVRHYSLTGDGRPTVYRPATKIDRTYLVVRTHADPAELAPSLTGLLAADPDLAVSDLRTMRARLDEARAPARLSLLLAQGFAWAALVLAAVGLYGVLASDVARGIPEIVLRLALGATAAVVARLVLRRGAEVALAGLSVGIVTAAGVAGLLAGHLHEIAPGDR